MSDAGDTEPIARDERKPRPHPVLSPLARAFWKYGSIIVIFGNAVAGAVISAHPIVCGSRMSEDVRTAIVSGAGWGLLAGLITDLCAPVGAIINVWWFGVPLASIIAWKLQ